MKTYFLTGDIDWRLYGAKWRTKKLNNGDFDYWLILEFINLEEATGEKFDEKYSVQISAISLQQAGEENIKAALRCCSIDLENIKLEYHEDMVITALSDYGVSASLDSFTGNNAKKLLQQARKALPCISGMFGFFMDGAKNRLGHTGWDFITGDLSLDKIDPAKKPTPNWHVCTGKKK